ncbi:MAG: acetate--CoA ligase family protein [Candidatus Syntropharchaeia archaeon]
MIEVLEKVKKEGRLILTEHESKLVLKEAGIPVTKEIIAESVEEAVEAAQKIGYPVVLKISSPEITHKSDFGGIYLDIKGKKELISCCEELSKKAKEKEFSFLVQKMAPKGKELLIGSKKDATFGPTIVFGLGGIFTEILEDTSLRICPIEKKDAEEMVREIKGYKILQGYRGEPPADLDAIIDALLKVSDLVTEHEEIAELDINPLFAYEKGVLAVDALIVLDQSLI